MRIVGENVYLRQSVLATLSWKISRIRTYLHVLRTMDYWEHRRRIQETRLLLSRQSGPALIVSLGSSLNDCPVELLKGAKSRKSLFAINAYPMTKFGQIYPPDYLILNDWPLWNPAPHSSEQKETIKLLDEFLESNKEVTVVQPSTMPRRSSFHRTIYYHGNFAPTLTSNIQVTKPMGCPNTTIFAGVATMLSLGFGPVFMLGQDSNFPTFLKETDSGYFLERPIVPDGQRASIPLKEFRANIPDLYASLAYHIDSWSLFKDYGVIKVGNKSHIDTLPSMGYEEVLKQFEVIGSI